MPKVTLGPGVGSPNPKNAKARQERMASELPRVRKAAENWRTGLAALITLITIVSVVKGRDTITALERGDQILVGVFLLIALLCATLGVLYAMKAAFGFPEIEGVSDQTDRQLKYRQSVDAVANIKVARTLTLVTLSLLVFAIGWTWYAPEKVKASVAYLSIERSDNSIECGSINSSGAGIIDLKTRSIASLEIPALDVMALELLASCP